MVGYFASRFSQNPSTSAAGEQTFSGIPEFGDKFKQPTSKKQGSEVDNIPSSAVKGDFNGDGAVTVDDESVFLIKYQSKDPSADLDGSGQVNTLDFAAFRQLVSGG